MTSRPDPSPTAAAERAAAAAPAISTATDRCRLDGWTLLVAPFSIRRHGMRYTSPLQLAIDLKAVEPGRYRLLAVHNFHVEDRNPRLDEAVAGVFLAALRPDGLWEDPERFPIECRALDVLADVTRPPEEAAP